jgi:hypothetical protein
VSATRAGLTAFFIIAWKIKKDKDDLLSLYFPKNILKKKEISSPCRIKIK